ncbi:Translation initiation factor IF-1 [Candidatus Hodgkinia cicadicola]|nr:Translation initiation factor IF-1 [Candidatus Hodgkinia cicadicola]
MNGDNGVVMCSLPNSMFRVRLSNRQKVVAHVSGKIKLESAKILVGDSVLVQRVRADSANGRIVHVYSI